MTIPTGVRIPVTAASSARRSGERPVPPIRRVESIASWGSTRKEALHNKRMPPSPAAPGSFFNALGEEVVHDGISGVDWRIAVYVIVTKDGRLLMLQPRPGEKWQLPGGAAQPHESLAEAAADECLEQTLPIFRKWGRVLSLV